jgi:type IV pilus assembly protein PilC
MISIDKLKYKKGNRTTNILLRIQHVFNKDIIIFNTGFGDRSKYDFYTQLETLVHAKIDLGNALKIIAETSKNTSTGKIYNDIYSSIINGDSLSLSLKKTGKFTAYEIFSLQIGEETGRLGFVLKEVASFYKKKIKQKQTIISALTYPSLILLVAIGAVLFMMNVVVPMFADVFKRFGNDLPFITKSIIKVSSFLIKSFPFLLLVLSILSVLTWQNRKKVWYKKAIAKVILNTPILGDIIKKIYLARFCAALSLLMESKVPIVNALGFVKEMVDFYPITSIMGKIENSILSGNSLYSSMSNFNIFDNKMLALIKIAEEVNKLDTMFDNLSTKFNEEADYNISVLNSTLEPLLIIFLGCIVGFILVGMYLPLFKLGVNVN